jgi:signal transduction histidine kinase/ActR/RegA family two-component response regulator
MKLSEVKEKVSTHVFSLRFLGEDKDFEAEFRTDYFENNLSHFRYCIIYSILLYAALGVLDYAVFHDNLNKLLSIRFLIIIPIFAFGLFYTYNKNYAHLWRLTNNFFVVITSAGFIAMMMICSPPMNYTFYAGVIICLIFGYTFIRSYFLDASVAGLIVLALYVVAALSIKTPFNIFANNFAYLFIINFLGMIICYTTESSARREFMLRKMLEAEKENVEAANSNLEIKVKERTQELVHSTRQLKNEILERKKSEAQNRELENKLIQAHKLESIGTLAGGIAHDFNNILSSIIGFTELALGEVEKGTMIEDDLQEVYAGGKRAKELVNQILAFARQSEEEIKPVQVSPIVKELLKFIRSSIPTTIEIKSNINSDSLIMGNGTQIHQIMMNLCTNAAHALESSGGEIEVILEDESIEKKSELIELGLNEGEYLKIVVSDTGSGIDPSIIGSIFEPYFTTKEIGEGTGMGLAMVHGIVTSYEGKIFVDSKLGEGTEFKIYIPTTNQRLDSKPYEKEESPGGTEKILFIDDEAPIAKMGSQMLSRLGYDVTTRISGIDALELFREHPDRFDLVITDMTMPNITGTILSKELLKLNPDIPIILCTGYSKSITEETAQKLGIKAFGFKPFIQADLAKTVREVLDEAKG